MEATEPLSLDDAVESLLAPVEEDTTEEAPQSEEVEADAEEAPVAEQTDDEEAETDEDDAEIDGDEVDYENEDEAEDAGNEELPDAHTVMVDGEPRQVTLEDLKRDYSGQAYIQKRMQEVATEKREAQAERDALHQERAQLAALAEQFQRGPIALPEPPSAELLHTDPIGYMQAKDAYDRAKEAYDQQQLQVRHLQQQQLQAQQQAQAQYVQGQAEALKQMIPDFADPDKGKALREKLRHTGDHYGFSDEELLSIVDARQIQVLNDARKWRELQASKATATAKARRAKPVVKPGSKTKTDPKQAARKKQRDRLRQTGSLDDALALLLE